MRALMIAPALALLLAGCGGRAPEAERNVTTVNSDEPANAGEVEANAVGNQLESENALATVLGMNDRQRNVVFVRALMDAGIDCDGVASSDRLDDVDGKPMWRANCRPPGGSHMITITPDGTAQIVSRSDR
ncbi:MAG: hypothetical protein KF730_05805 [Sphingomonas sp.]|uniref:hypothetical protein n=1 Tax=Sphingomonas sp. TaxID=28214 RepID=UPI0025CE00D9|nr:hypothetical protein [Sphingomonas sp.]MBX3564077.1 hypothetical protein [Sphingomonas sp.]